MSKSDQNNVALQLELAVRAQAQQLADLCIAVKWKIVTAESCTGGLIARALTDIAGSSQWFERGYVTYSNDAKIECLHVSPRTLTEYGAVSEPVAREMAMGALAHSKAQIALAVTGIAGPDGGSREKPVGTVVFAWASLKRIEAATRLLDGDRAAIRLQSALYSMARAAQYAQPGPAATGLA